MKSSILGIFSWNHNQRPICQSDNIIQNSVGLTRSNIESENTKETAGQSKAKANRAYCPHSQRKMPPLLRLNSEGEISSGKHFCDRAVSSQFDKIYSKLSLSNSFDSSNINRVATGSSFESPNKNIPRHPSFTKSLSDPSGSPVHHSFPPPSSSAIRNNFSCPVAKTLSPYSSSPRVLGNIHIFEMNPMDSTNDIEMQSKCAISSPCANKCSINGHMNILESSSCKNVEKMTSKLNTMSGNDFQFSVDHDSNQSIASQASEVNCSSQNSSQSFTGNDSSSILLIRKKKRKRPRNKRKRELKQCQDKESTSFRPSSCSSPSGDNSGLNLQDSSTSKSSTSGVLNVKIVSPICHIVSTSQKQNEVSSPVDTTPPSRSRLFCSSLDHSVDEDGLSEDDDLVFEDSSVVLFENSPPSLTKSRVSLNKKRSNKNDKWEDLNKSCEEQKSSSSGLHFTLSVTVSEDEDNDSSDWDLSTSPPENDQLLFEFEFNTGLCLDRIIGHVSTTESPETKAMNKRLRDLNLKWKKVYGSLDSDTLSLSPIHQQKVHFASDDDLTTVHIVGDEDRAGEWQRYALERDRFQKRIGDVEKVLAPVLCENHRAKVLGRINV